jgi:hypothetical protein
VLITPHESTPRRPAAAGYSPTQTDRSPLLVVLDIVAAVLDRIGSDRIELVTLTRNRLSLQPADLAEGEQIAQVLGLDSPLDHRMFVPGHTLWCGQVHGLEVQVRSVLRVPAGAGL